MNIVNFPGAGPTPFEIVLSRRGDRMTVTFLGAMTDAAAQILHQVVDRLAGESGHKVTLDLSGAH